jgi:hypothetical protein
MTRLLGRGAVLVVGWRAAERAAQAGTRAPSRIAGIDPGGTGRE